MALLKALSAQLLSTAVIVLALRTGLIARPDPWLAAFAQGALAAAIAAALRSERWWLYIHCGFAPLALAALRLDIDARWYLAAFTLTALVYWSSYRTRVPLYLSNRATAQAVATLVAEREHGNLLDIGSGTGSLLRPLASCCPGWKFHGIESAPLPHLVARLLGAKIANLELSRGDFFDADWSRYDIVYAFLSPVPMARVWQKARREMRPDSLLVSNSFAVPDIAPERVVEVGDRRNTQLLCYRPGSRKAKKGR